MIQWKLHCQQQQHQQAPVYREENMAIPYDEIEQTKKRKETKNVSVNNNGDDNQWLLLLLKRMNCSVAADAAASIDCHGWGIKKKFHIFSLFQAKKHLECWWWERKNGPNKDVKKMNANFPRILACLFVFFFGIVEIIIIIIQK